MEKRALIPIVCAVAAATMLTGAAHADTVGQNYGGFAGVRKGVAEVGLDNLFLLRYNNVPLTEAPDTTVTTMDLSYVGGLTPRYFVVDNVSLSLNLDFFYRKGSTKTETKNPPAGAPADTEETATDTGFLGFGMVHYYLRLGNSMFFKPGIGGGGFVGSRRRPTPGVVGQETKTSLSGGAGRLDLGFAFYTSEHFNLKAGLDVIMRFGSEKPEDGATTTAGTAPESQSFTNAEAGFNVGFAYSF